MHNFCLCVNIAVAVTFQHYTNIEGLRERLFHNRRLS